MSIVPGIDGKVDQGILAECDCETPDICNISEHSLVCGFVNLLPSGPLWDRPKWQILSGEQGSSSTSLVNYAAYNGRFLYDLISGTLWESIRESKPWTAVTTLDSWLERMGWVDCYQGLCRSPQLGKLTPFEIMGMCGPEYCDPEYSVEFARALKSAIVKSLWRLRLGVVPTIDIINFILEPLGAQIVPVWEGADGQTACEFDKICFFIKKTRDWLLVPQEECGKPPVYIPAYITPCDRPAGTPQMIWPGLLMAECIFRSLLPNNRICIDGSNCEEPDNPLQPNWNQNEVVFGFRSGESATELGMEYLFANNRPTLGFLLEPYPNGISGIRFVQSLNTAPGVPNVMTGQILSAPNRFNGGHWKLRNSVGVLVAQGRISYTAASTTLNLLPDTSFDRLLKKGETYFVFLTQGA